MEIVERYLQTVKSALPDAQRDDIINELSEDIHSEIEEKESELGRPLSEAELEVILKRHGHPLIVASRYRQDQRSFSFGRQLIGPVLFPFYAKVLSFNLGITSVVILIIFTALLASGQSLSFHEAISTLFLQLLIQFAIVTPIFMAFDRHLEKYPDRWDPRTPNRRHYPAVTVAAPTTVSRLESISQIVAIAVFLAWIRTVRGLPSLIFGPAATFLKAAPVWHQLYLPVVLLALVQVAQSVINLIRPGWVLVRSFTRIAAGGAGLVICLFLLRAGVWVVPASGGNLSSGYQEAIAIVNKTLLYSLSAALVIQAIILLTELRRLARGTPHTPARKPGAS
jgi:hypothetical protein